MATMQVKDFPDQLMHACKVAALSNRQTLRSYVIEQLANAAEIELNAGETPKPANPVAVP